MTQYFVSVSKKLFSHRISNRNTATAATRLRAPASRRYPAAPLEKSGSRVQHDRTRS